MTRCCDGPRCRLLAGDHRHGTPGAYSNFWCRCAPCRAASSAARLALYHRNKAAARRPLNPGSAPAVGRTTNLMETP